MNDAQNATNAVSIEPPNPTAQALTQIFEKTIEVDPRQLVRKFELDTARKVLEQTHKNIEGDKSIKEVFATELLTEAKRQVAEKEKALGEYQPKEKARITIGYISDDVLIEYDLREQTALSLEIGSLKRNEAFHQLDRLLVRHGVKDHKGIAFKGVEVPFSQDKAGSASSEIIGIYSRAKWLRSLRWEIYRYNTLAEEKKSR